MNKIPKWLRSTFTQSFASFLAGILASIAVRAMFGGIIPLTIDVLAILASGLVVLSIAILASLRQDIVANFIQSRLSVKVYHAKSTPGGDSALYDPIIESISSAKESIRVVSLFRLPTLESSSARRKYYEELNKILATKHRRGERFLYERILQVEDVQLGRIGSDQIDPITYEHCRLVTELKKSRTPLTIHLQQIPNILSATSFVIIDDREVLIFIPSITRTKSDQLEAVHLGTGTFFTDYDGSLAKEMMHLFDELQYYSDPILSVEPPQKAAT